MDVYVR